MALPGKEQLTFENVTVDARTQQAYHDLSRWIRWLASSSQIPGHWYMNADDITAELYFVLYKVAGVYANKPYDEFIILAKSSMRNAISSMRYHVGVTHRKAELTAIRFEDASNLGEEDGATYADHISVESCMDTISQSTGVMGLDPAIYVEAAERFLDKAEQLSSIDLEVLDALLGNDTRLSLHIRLMTMRRNFVYQNPTLAITPALVARALDYPTETIRASFERIRSML